jgi:hypothetical protein
MDLDMEMMFKEKNEKNEKKKNGKDDNTFKK